MLLQSGALSHCLNMLDKKLYALQFLAKNGMLVCSFETYGLRSVKLKGPEMAQKILPKKWLFLLFMHHVPVPNMLGLSDKLRQMCVAKYQVMRSLVFLRLESMYYHTDSYVQIMCILRHFLAYNTPISGGGNLCKLDVHSSLPHVLSYVYGGDCATKVMKLLDVQKKDKDDTATTQPESKRPRISR